MNFEDYFDLKAIKGRYQTAIAESTAKALQGFCFQEQEFAQAVEQSGKSFQDCLDAVTKNVGQSVSDFDVYSRAAKFYFPGAEIHFRMEIDLIGNADRTAPEQSKQDKKLSVAFDSLADW